MTALSRRKFLIASTGLGAAGLATGAMGITWPELMREAKKRPLLAEGSGVLVILTLYGGNDGINTVIPYADNAYHDARPELAYAPEDVLPLDGQLGLNPALKGLEQWNNRKLAIMRGVGYPQPDHSHFRSMDIWQTASPSEPVPTGWIGRWLDATGHDPLRAVNIGTVLPPLAVGEKYTAAALSPYGNAASADRFAATMTRSASTIPTTPRRWRRSATPTARPAPPTQPSARSNRLRASPIHWPAS